MVDVHGIVYWPHHVSSEEDRYWEKSLPKSIKTVSDARKFLDSLPADFGLSHAKNLKMKEVEF